MRCAWMDRVQVPLAIITYFSDHSVNDKTRFGAQFEWRIVHVVEFARRSRPIFFQKWRAWDVVAAIH